MFPIRGPNAWIVNFTGGPQSRANRGYPLFLASTPPPFNLPKVTNGSPYLRDLDDISLGEAWGLLCNEISEIVFAEVSRF